jgi:hypothetical protein
MGGWFRDAGRVMRDATQRNGVHEEQHCVICHHDRLTFAM